jgi:hypothetical protein
MTALRRHIYLEEEFVFPPLRASGMFAPVLVMLAEHRELWRTMAELESGLDEGSTPTELVALARTLLAQLERHNSKEEPTSSPEPSSARAARPALLSISSAIRASMVCAAMIRQAVTGWSWPIRWMRSMAWVCSASVQDSSASTTLEATCRLTPTPAAVREHTATATSGSLVKASMACWRAVRV